MKFYCISDNGINYIKHIDLYIGKNVSDIIVNYTYSCGKCYGFYDDFDSNSLVMCICCDIMICNKCKYCIPIKNRIWEN